MLDENRPMSRRLRRLVGRELLLLIQEGTTMKQVKDCLRDMQREKTSVGPLSEGSSGSSDVRIDDAAPRRVLKPGPIAAEKMRWETLNEQLASKA